MLTYAMNEMLQLFLHFLFSNENEKQKLKWLNRVIIQFSAVSITNEGTQDRNTREKKSIETLPPNGWVCERQQMYYTHHSYAVSVHVNSGKKRREKWANSRKSGRERKEKLRKRERNETQVEWTIYTKN